MVDLIIDFIETIVEVIVEIWGKSIAKMFKKRKASKEI